jgi:hypothetical protein
VTVFEFLIELIRSASIGYTTVEIDQTHSEILCDYIALFELLVYDTSFGIM